MALEKNIEIDDTGVTASYWKICETYMNWFTKEAKIIIWGFKDKTARQGGKRPLKKLIFSFTNSSDNQFPFSLEGNSIAEGYTAIKNYIIGKDEQGNNIYGIFHDAEDV